MRLTALPRFLSLVNQRARSMRENTRCANAQVNAIWENLLTRRKWMAGRELDTNRELFGANLLLTRSAIRRRKSARSTRAWDVAPMFGSCCAY